MTETRLLIPGNVFRSLQRTVLAEKTDAAARKADAKPQA
jgi:hypothetical protein